MTILGKIWKIRDQRKHLLLQAKSLESEIGKIIYENLGLDESYGFDMLVADPVRFSIFYADKLEPYELQEMAQKAKEIGFSLVLISAQENRLELSFEENPRYESQEE